MPQPTTKLAEPVAYYSFPHAKAFHGPKGPKPKADENLVPAAAELGAKKPPLLRQVVPSQKGQADLARQHVLVPPRRMGLELPAPGLRRALAASDNLPRAPQRRCSGCEE